ncbi:MAG: serine hydrolase, partial [Clostridia bacterium]|nr:serine hydrolase [Clostridia bacterium]
MAEKKDPKALPHAQFPEQVGVSSAELKRLIEDFDDQQIELHSLMVLREGKVALECYRAPYRHDAPHTMYSVSKSFTYVAIGMLVTEGRLTLDDKVADFFPEYLPEHPSPYTLRATVRDLLRMATPNEDNSYDWDDPDFVKTFFDNKKPKHEPGTVFHYDTAGTTTLCAIVEKITGMPILDYMRPLLDTLGVSRDIWCIQTPEGRSWTGSGILCTSRNLLRFGLFCLNRGEWQGRQL